MVAAVALMMAASDGISGVDAARAERIYEVFNALGPDNIELLDAFYDADVRFVDPVGEREGLDDLKEYYADLYANVESIGFEFTSHVVEGDLHVVEWTMDIELRKLNRGKPYTVEGCSFIEFGENDRVVYHRDYFDLGELVYERAPIVRFFVTQVKMRL